MRGHIRALTLATLVVTATATAIVGCGGGGGNGADAKTPGNVIYTTNVFVSFTREPDRLPFDPRSARLIAASNQLTQIAGHPIGYQFDAALLPEYQASFEEALISSIENTAKDLDALKHDDPESFAGTATKLTKIACSYDVVAKYPKPVFTVEKGTLDINVPARAGELVGRGAVYRGLQDAFEEGLRKRFENASSVSASDEVLYYRWLTSTWRPKYQDLSTEQAINEDERAVRLLKVLSFASNVKSAELAAKASDWLLGEGDYFPQAYTHHPRVVSLARKDGTFKRAEAAYVAWLTAAYKRMNDKERLKTLKLVTVRPFTQDREGTHRYVTFAFPGLAPMDLMEPVFQEWVKAGHPAHVGGDDAKTDLFQFVACPREIDPQGGHIGPHCEEDLYRIALESPQNRDRLLSWAVGSKDPYVAETLIRNYIGIHDADGRDAQMFFWRGLEQNDAAWTAATKVFAEEIGTTDDGMLQDEARRLWKAYPDRRGSLAYLLAHLDQYDNGKVPWATWAKNSGGALGASDFARYLTHGPRALALVHLVWPLLAPGYSRMDVLQPRLDAFLADDSARRFRQRDPYLFVQDLTQLFCHEHATGELGKLKAYLQRWVQQHPSDEKVYSTLIADATTCMGGGGQPAASGNQGVHDPKPKSGRRDMGF
jgi:hypothetical protein